MTKATISRGKQAGVSIPVPTRRVRQRVCVAVDHGKATSPDSTTGRLGASNGIICAGPNGVQCAALDRLKLGGVSAFGRAIWPADASSHECAHRDVRVGRPASIMHLQVYAHVAPAEIAAVATV